MSYQANQQGPVHTQIKRGPSLASLSLGSVDEALVGLHHLHVLTHILAMVRTRTQVSTLDNLPLCCFSEAGYRCFQPLRRLLQEPLAPILYATVKPCRESLAAGRTTNVSTNKTVVLQIAMDLA
jgi:hypothetical protein